MEHRWCKRWKIELDVQLKGQGARVVSARSRNICLDGMFVEIAPASLSAQKLVHIQLPTAVGIARQEALVLHACAQGVGLMFCAIDNEDRHQLARYLTEVNQQRRDW